MTKAIVVEAPGGWEQTRLVDVAEPTAEAGEAIVALKAASLNPADYFQIEGSYPGGPKPPFVSGRDGAGVVLVSDRAGRWPIGSKVVVLQTSANDLSAGTFCERQRFAADILAPLPDGWSFEDGAAAPLVYLTAWQALVDCGALKAGQTVVVTGASGGVGSAAVQLALAMDAKVVALSRSESKRARLAKLGAQHVFEPGPALKKQFFEAVGKKGANLVVETVGGDSLATSVHLLGQRGRVSVLGLLAGVNASFSIPSLMFKQASIHGVVVYGYSPEQAASAWEQIVEVLNNKRVRPIIDRTFPLAEFRAAFDQLRASPFGKVVLTIAK